MTSLILITSSFVFFDITFLGWFTFKWKFFIFTQLRDHIFIKFLCYGKRDSYFRPSDTCHCNSDNMSSCDWQKDWQFFYVSKYAHIVYHWKGKSYVSSVLAIIFSCHVTCCTSIVSYVSNSKIDPSWLFIHNHCVIHR